MLMFMRIMAVVTALLFTGFVAHAQSPSVLRVTGVDTPGKESVSARNAFIGGQVTLTLSPEDSPLEEGLLYNALFIKPVWTAANGRLSLPVVTKFNLDDFDIIDVFDEDGITASAAPYYLLSTDEAPWILHGALTGGFDVKLAKPSIIKGFVGVEKTIPNIIEGMNGSVGLNAHWGDVGRGTSFELLGTLPLSEGSGLVVRATNAYYTGQGRQSGLQIGLITTTVN